MHVLVDDGAEGGERAQLDLFGLVALQQVEEDVEERARDRIVASAFAQLLFLVYEHQRDDVDHHARHHVAHVRLGEHQLLVEKRCRRRRWWLRRRWCQFVCFALGLAWLARSSLGRCGFEVRVLIQNPSNAKQ